MRNSKKIIIFFACIVCFILIVMFLDTALYPVTYTHNDIQTAITKKHDVVLLGTSNGKMGIDPDYMLQDTDYQGVNLCLGSQYPVDSYYLAKLVFEKQKPSVLIYEVDPGYYTLQKEEGNNYNLFYHEFPASLAKLEYFSAIMPQADYKNVLFPFYEYGIVDRLPKALNTIKLKLSGENNSVDIFQSSSASYHENGFIERFPVKEENFPAYQSMEFSAEDVFEENMKYLDKLVELCRKNDVEMIAIQMPVYSGTIELDKEAMSAAWDYFGNYFNEKNVPFYNFNTDYYSDGKHDIDSFVDYEGHMNGDAARDFSVTLGKVLFANS